MGVGNDIRNDEDELDPAQAAMVRKMRRLVGISTSVMLVGFLAVMSVIVYRLVKPGAPAAPAEAIRRVLDVAPGARIVAATGQGRFLYITLAGPDGALSVQVLDAETLRTHGTVETAR
jgi:hypothetical protein